MSKRNNKNISNDDNNINNNDSIELESNEQTKSKKVRMTKKYIDELDNLVKDGSMIKFNIFRIDKVNYGLNKEGIEIKEEYNYKQISINQTLLNILINNDCKIQMNKYYVWVDLREIRKINYSNMRLSSIPIIIYNLTNLTELCLPSNRLTNILDVHRNNGIKCLTNLKKLDLSNNLLRSDEVNDIRYLTNLTDLNIGFKDDYSIYGHTLNININLFTDLTKLESLNIDGSRIIKNDDLDDEDHELNHIPSSIINLSAISCQLKSKIYLSNLTNLQSLNLSHNEIDSIIGLVNVVNLNTSHCGLSNLPYLPSTIKNLNCSHNKLNNIDLSDAININKLNVSFNHTLQNAHELFDGFKNYSNLVNVNFSGCRLHELHDVVFKENRIRFLNLSGNPIIEMCSFEDAIFLRHLEIDLNNLYNIIDYPMFCSYSLDLYIFGKILPPYAIVKSNFYKKNSILINEIEKHNTSVNTQYNCENTICNCRSGYLSLLSILARI